MRNENSLLKIDNLYSSFLFSFSSGLWLVVAKALLSFLRELIFLKIIFQIWRPLLARARPAGGVFIGYKMMTIFDNKLQKG